MNQIKGLIDEYKSYPLSDSDLLHLMQQKANLVTYTELKNYKSIDHLLGPYDVVFVLFLWEPHYGHWTCLTKHENLIEFFDPYGQFPDSYLKDIPEPWRTQSGQDKPVLSRLMKESPYNLSYNEFSFQKEGEEISSCGRWSVLRGLLKDLTLEQFKDLFLNRYGDDIATILTSKIL